MEELYMTNSQNGIWILYGEGELENVNGQLYFKLRF